MKENESKKSKEQTYFLKVWLEHEDFNKWLSPFAENTEARCK